MAMVFCQLWLFGLSEIRQRRFYIFTVGADTCSEVLICLKVKLVPGKAPCKIRNVSCSSGLLFDYRHYIK